MEKENIAADGGTQQATTITRKDFLKRSIGAAGFLALPSMGLLTSCDESSGGDKNISGQVKELINKMTLEEKVSQLQYDAPAIDRLDIPKYNWWNECLHGVARAGFATVFPQAIGLAATWDASLMYKIAEAISDEARAKHSGFVKRGLREIYMGLTFWAPNINLVRDPRWGRGQETYGEDPYLTAKMGIYFIKGLQGDDSNSLKLVGTPKHYAVYSGPEPLRDTMDIEISSQDLRATYLPMFEAAVKQANARSVMCAKTSVNGMPCCGNNPLLHKILRDDWNFDGYVVSDCGAIDNIWKNGKANGLVEAAAIAMKSGTDLSCRSTYKNLGVAVKKGLVKGDKLDRSLQRLFEARYHLGMINGKEKRPYTDIPYSVVSSSKHKKLSREMARESIVLLKNEPNSSSSKPILPLSDDIKKIAVIGPNADDEWTMLGNYHGTPDEIITPLKGIQAKAGQKDLEVHYALGCDTVAERRSVTAIPSDFLDPAKGSGSGLYGEYFANGNLEGSPSITRVDDQIDFTWLNDTPITGEMADTFSVRWTGELIAPETGQFILSVKAVNGFRFYIESEKKAEVKSGHVAKERRISIKLNAWKKYDIKIEYFSKNHNPDPQVHLRWSQPDRKLADKALQTAKKADAVVLCMGLNSNLEGEEMPIKVEGFNHGDKTNLKIPQTQIKLMKKLHNLGKPTVLVLLTGSAVTFPWAEQNIPAILETWYGGQEGGHAVADVLFGDYNPGGRLPVTFYKSIDDVPEFTDYSMKGRTYRYFNGEPLYPFGYGLSYTTFDYSELKLPGTIKKGNLLKTSVTVKNTGNRAGDEVVQLYVSYPESAIDHKPIRNLQAFRRVHLKAGESKKIKFSLKPEQLALIDETGSPVFPEDNLKISIGGKQPGFTGRPDARTTNVLEKTVAVS